MQTNIKPIETVRQARPTARRRFLQLVKDLPLPATAQRELEVTERQILRNERLRPSRIIKLAQATGVHPWELKKRERILCSRRSTPELAMAVDVGAISVSDASAIVRQAERLRMPVLWARKWVNEQAMTLLMTDLREAKLGISIY